MFFKQIVTSLLNSDPLSHQNSSGYLNTLLFSYIASKKICLIKEEKARTFFHEKLIVRQVSKVPIPFNAWSTRAFDFMVYKDYKT